MSLIRCYECGKEISSLATACPSCGAPPPSTVVPSPIPTRARPVSRVKQILLGTLAVFTGLVLVLVIRGVTRGPNTSSVVASPTPATAETATKSSPPPIAMVLQGSASPAAAKTPVAESSPTSAPPIEAAAESSPGSTAVKTKTAESATTGSPPIETVSESLPTPAAAQTAYASDTSSTAVTPSRATYRVTGIAQGDYLNVRDGAGSESEVVTKLEPDTGGILLGTKRVTSGATTWQEITVHGQTGWVNAAYISPETQVPTSPTESSTEP
jgi:hypothetical protein